MWKVISPRSCRESSRVLQTTLNDIYPISDEKIINWGNSSVSQTNVVNLFGNSLSSVYRSVNKEVMFNLLKDTGTVPVVKEFIEPGVYQHLANLSDGRGVIFVSNPASFIPNVLSTQKIIGNEYRVYFCYDMQPYIFKKVKVELGTNSEIHNSSAGWGYLQNPKELKTIKNLHTILKEYAIKTANILELSYGAVDFIVEKDTYNVYTLETNSAPTLITSELLRDFSNAIARRLYVHCFDSSL